MTPIEQCLTVCAALARYDRPGAADVGRGEIRRMLERVGACPTARVRALETLAFELAITVELTDTGAAIDRAIADRLRGLGAAAI